jgi:ribosomal protein S18 acetylase RimI-like enzyme
MTHNGFADGAQLRRATTDDAAALAAITISTFTETFGHLYPAEDLQTYLAKFSVDHCRKQLADQNSAVWFAVTHDANGKEVVAGYVLAGRCHLPVKHLEPTAGEVKQLYLDADYQNRKLGTRLMDIALTWLEAQQWSPLYVGVWSENFGAQRFYARYGFSKVGDYGFPVGNTIDHEFILKR